MNRLLHGVGLALAVGLLAAAVALAVPAKGASPPSFSSAYKELFKRLEESEGGWDNLRLQLHAGDEVCTADKRMESDPALKPHMPMLWKEFESMVREAPQPSVVKVGGYVESAQAQVAFIKFTIAKQFKGGDPRIVGLLTRGANKIQRGLTIETETLKEVNAGIERWLVPAHDCAGAVKHFQIGNKLAAETNKDVNDGLSDLRTFKDDLSDLMR